VGKKGNTFGGVLQNPMVKEPRGGPERDLDDHIEGLIREKRSKGRFGLTATNVTDSKKKGVVRISRKREVRKAL